MKKILIGLVFLSMLFSGCSQKQHKGGVRPTKNVILMIPDGTTLAAYSAARWYKDFNGLGRSLAVDPYICGTVLTFSSNAPIGDSAPTTSCYMTGVPQQAGNVAIYPLQDENDLIPINADDAYQPLATILEASKYYMNKATGLVATVRFAHATPADCASHYYNRNAYDVLSSQMAYNDLDVVIASGNQYITDDIKEHFERTNTTLIQDDIDAFRKFDKSNSLWALFGDKDMSYDIDRDTLNVPSIAEMTDKAIKQLSMRDEGFFLMVEGSQIDWAAHANDATGVITDYIAFDNAVQVAIDFAKENGETTVIVLSDHGTGGFSIGRSGMESYTKASIEYLFGNISKYKRTSRGMAEILSKTKLEDFRDVFLEFTGIELTEAEYKSLAKSINVKEQDYMQIANSQNFISAINKIMSDKIYFGFTTGGHTGEEVLLSAYHPHGDVPMGMNTNVEINKYLSEVSGLPAPLSEMTEEAFAKHTEVFEGLTYLINKSGEYPELVVKKGEDILRVPAFKSVAYFNKELIDLRSVTVYVDKNDTFYLPKSLANSLK